MDAAFQFAAMITPHYAHGAVRGLPLTAGAAYLAFPLSPHLPPRAAPHFVATGSPGTVTNPILTLNGVDAGSSAAIYYFTSSAGAVAQLAAAWRWRTFLCARAAYATMRMAAAAACWVGAGMPARWRLFCISLSASCAHVARP